MEVVLADAHLTECKNRNRSDINLDLCDLDWIKRKSKPTNDKHLSNRMSLVDLYCGCGGMTLGVLESLRANNIALDIKLAVDMDVAAMDVYKSNFLVSELNTFVGDINSLCSTNIGQPLNENEENLKTNIPDLDILVAGPPCQGHSNLNNHTRRDDPRNTLYLNAIRFVEILKPKIAIIENVSTVIHDKENVVQKGQLALESCGYTIVSRIINASKLGLAQTRKRHFHIAFLDTIEDFELNCYFKDKVEPLSSYIGDLADRDFAFKGIFNTPSVTKKINRERIDYLFKNNLFDLPDSERPDCHKNKSHSYKSCYGRLDWNKPAQTLTSGFGSMGQGRFVHPLNRRVITPHEAARIQGFPDFFDFNTVKRRGDLHTMIANAVPPKMIAVMVDLFLKRIYNELKE